MSTIAKKRANGDGTIHKRPDGRWELRVPLGHDPGTGKLIRKSFYFRTQKEAAAAQRRITHERDEDIYTVPTKLTVGGWLDQWHRDYLGGVKESTAAKYEQYIRVHLKPALGAVKLHDLTAPTIQHLYNESAGSLSAASIRCMHGVLRKAMQQAVAVGYLRVNPCEACRLPRAEKQEVQPIQGEVLTAFRREIEKDEFSDLFFVAIFTGMRKGELLGLRWPDVDFQAGSITIRQQLQRSQAKGGSYILTTPKNGKPRRIIPAPDVMKRLHRVQIGQKKSRLRAGSAWDNPDDLVFTNALGEHLQPMTVWRHFKKCIADAGMEEARFHDMRHTFATLFCSIFAFNSPFSLTFSAICWAYCTIFRIKACAHHPRFFLLSLPSHRGDATAQIVNVRKRSSKVGI